MSHKYDKESPDRNSWTNMQDALDIGVPLNILPEDSEEIQCTVCDWTGLEEELDYDSRTKEYFCPDCGRIFVDA